MKLFLIPMTLFLSTPSSASETEIIPGTSCIFESASENASIQFRESGLTNSDPEMTSAVTCPVFLESTQVKLNYLATLENISLQVNNNSEEQIVIECNLNEQIGQESKNSYFQRITLESNALASVRWEEIGISSNLSTFSVQCSLPASATIVSLLNKTNSSVDNSCAQEEFFLPYKDFVSASCDEQYVNITSMTGLPKLNSEDQRDRPMVGITAWINRVAVPFLFNWKIPRVPQIQDSYSLATARGPIAFAINGVPIFHYERRPDVSTHPDDYEAGSDTVLAGELDQCGGHAGQGEDYHYHYAPVCLLDEHDLNTPIAYGLDGIPIYYGSGGTDYYGSSRYNEINLVDEKTLDLCNAKLDSAGSYRYYTTSSPPYLIGCHRGVVDSSLQINVPPFPIRRQGTPVPEGSGEFGEAVQTIVTDFYQDAQGYYHLEHEVAGNTEAVIYKKISETEDCWEFEHRSDAEISGTKQNACR